MTIEEWAKDFKSYVNELQMPRDDYKGIMLYIDEALALQKEQEAINYTDCSNAMLKMWMECVLTDGEYNRIMDKLNKAHKEGKI